MDIVGRVEQVLKDHKDRSDKPNIARQLEMSRRLEERGLIRKETYNVVRPLNARLVDNKRAA